jgi:hypothetical protein
MKKTGKKAEILIHEENEEEAREKDHMLLLSI